MTKEDKILLTNFMNEIVKAFGTRMSKEKLVEKLYRVIEIAGLDVCILNEKYLIVNGVKYQFIKKQAGWEAKEF